jgi:CheY-like chemotaxis protein
LDKNHEPDMRFNKAFSSCAAALTAPRRLLCSPFVEASEEREMLGHILIVEDHPAVLSGLSLLLSKAGYQVTTATTVVEAAQRARENPDLDLVMTDYHLSAADTARQVITAVREVFGPTFRVIVSTGDTAKVHFFDDDAYVCWLCKPLNTGLLLAVLRNFVPHGVPTEATAVRATEESARRP